LDRGFLDLADPHSRNAIDCHNQSVTALPKRRRFLDESVRQVKDLDRDGHFPGEH
jgi:hypothetical protein